MRDWAAESARVDLGKFKISGLRFVIDPPSGDGGKVMAHVHMGSVNVVGDPGQTMELAWHESISRGAWANVIPGTRAEAVRRIVMNALAHEVDEWLRVDGKRVHEPHPVVGSPSARVDTQPSRAELLAQERYEAAAWLDRVREPDAWAE